MRLESSEPPVDVDAEQFGNETRYINSVKMVVPTANVKFVEAYSHDGPHVLVYTIQPIVKGQELLADFDRNPVASRNIAKKEVKTRPNNGESKKILNGFKNSLPEISSTTIKLDRNSDILGRYNSSTLYKGFYYLTPVAIKEFHGDLESFNTECNALSQYRHPNVVPAFGWTALKVPGHERKSVALILELAELGSLDSWVTQYREYVYEFSLIRYFIQIAKDIACAFAYFHDMKKTLNQFIPGSLKPMNVWLFGIDILMHGELQFANLRAKIADVAEREDSAFVENRSLWLAPEYMGSKKFDASGDVYSFGLLCCFYWSKGKLPSTAGIPPHIPDVCPEKWKDLLSRCLNLDPNSRPSFSQILSSLKEIEDQSNSLV